MRPLAVTSLRWCEKYRNRVRNTRGHSYQLYQQFSNCTSRSKFFSERVVTLRNSLPGHRVSINLNPH